MLKSLAHSWLRWCIALLAMMLILMAVQGKTASASTPAVALQGDPAYKLVYEAWEGEGHDQYHIYVANFDGSNPRMVSGDAVTSARQPIWSPDGKRIAFLAGLVGGQWQIPTQVYVVNADGSMFHLLQHDPNGIDFSPWAWSPDSLHLVTVHGLELDVIDLQGKILFHRTAAPDQNNDAIYDERWSPDGKHLIIVSAQDLDIVDLSGNVVSHQSRSPDQNKMGTVVWSPDGQSIAYWSNNVLYLMNADGSNLRQLAKTNADLGHSAAIWPVWSPDSKQLAFTPEEGTQGSQQIYLINADGSHSHPLAGAVTGAVTDQFGPEWSPDGKQITYTVAGNIHIVDSDGSNDRFIKTAYQGGAAASWSPDGQYFLYELSDSGTTLPFVAHVISVDGARDYSLPEWTIYASWQPGQPAAPSSVGGSTATLPPGRQSTSKPVPATRTPTPTATWLPTLPGCNVSGSDLSNLGSNELFWSLANQDTTTSVTLQALTVNWKTNQQGPTLQTVVVNEDAIWEGNETNSPATVKGPWLKPLTLNPGESEALIFQFSDRLDLKPGFTYTATATFDKGCRVNNSFTVTP